ncbi:MAG: hypothetical protein EXR06_00685, partial [Rickettsiales bacterium]|nr:hypothetical protein [Rickettsiales bacterium]
MAPSAKKVSTKTQEERLEAIRAALASETTIDTKIKAVKDEMSFMGGIDQRLLVKAMDANEEIRRGLQALIGKQTNGDFLPNTGFLRMTVEANRVLLKLELEQEAAKQMDLR